MKINGIEVEKTLAGIRKQAVALSNNSRSEVLPQIGGSDEQVTEIARMPIDWEMGLTRAQIETARRIMFHS
jgi:hypothetical protein